YIRCGDQAIVGIVQNTTTQFVHVFNYALLPDDGSRRRFLELGEQWWYGSNTRVPIDLFLGEKFDPFRNALRGYSRKDVDGVFGPTITLGEMYNRRVKRRRVEFMKGGR